MLVALLWTLASALTGAVASRAPAQLKNLTLTALVGKHGRSALECWAMAPELVESTATGTVGALSYGHIGMTGNSSYSLFTALSNAGLHNAPTAQYVMILTGSGELSFPSADPADPCLRGNYTVVAGDILIAVDTADVSSRGHNSVWQAGTSVLQMPFMGDTPNHVVLHEGGCHKPHM
ncbi:hypothetical protein B0H15DRAFT_871695 [Mycena belliarum]|uniref:Small secreted protein n=1 Tax=Mycena belliarum TaxID=1033014 RepID=A0AAD6TL74_9AGAR|nr:hypothetical protein B0H15DRAFT_871695 [Mycena belliae]